jgi:DNA mismatch repair protein MSH2
MSEPNSAIRTTAVSVVVDLKPNTSNSSIKSAQHSPQVRIAVAAQIPRARTGTEDTLKWTLQHWNFWDDRRQYTHLDALLTRLAPLSVVHLGCTERTQVKAGKNGPSPAAVRRAQQVTDILSKLSNVISSRGDLTTTPSDDATKNDDLVHVHSQLPSHGDLEDTLQHVLGETAFLSYRGSVLDDLTQKCLALLLYGQGASGRTDATQNTCDFLAGVLSSHLVLDRTASEAIHLLPPPNSGMASVVGGRPENNSLYGILNPHCVTKMGSRTLLVWLRQPLVDLDKIMQRQNAVALLVEQQIYRNRIRDEGLAGMAGVDIDALGAHLASYASEVVGPTSKALSCLYKLYLLANQQAPVLSEALNDLQLSEGQQENSLLHSFKEGFKMALTELERSIQLVEAVLDLEEAPRHFMVKSSFTPEMEEVKKELLVVEQELRDCHDEMNQEWASASGQPVGQVRLEETTDGTMQFRLPNTNDSKILEQKLGGQVTTHRILKNGVYFSNKALRQLCTKKQDLLEEFDNQQREIVANAMSVAATYAPVLERCASLVSELDVICCLANMAAYSPTGYCRPELTDGEEDGLGIEVSFVKGERSLRRPIYNNMPPPIRAFPQLKDARHPCVELQDSIEYIPNNVRLIFGESSFLMVTGPNMGGKSTYIRALGAIVTLAQIGSYVPCTSAKINIVHHILARVGAGDAQDRGISTFMAEMLEASSILRTATKRSLIIIDELGRGTSTFDGFGLATAISEYIIQRIGCMTVFATHFHELTALEEEETVVKNCHVTAALDGVNGLTFMYEVRPGPCLESFGIQVAEMANVPKTVIDDAKRKAKHLENFDYRKKQRGSTNDDTSQDAELAAKFRQLPLKSLQTQEEKLAALRQLIQ